MRQGAVYTHTHTTKQGAVYTHTHPRRSRVPRAALAMGSMLKGRKGRSCWEGCRQRGSSQAADDSLPLLAEPGARVTSPLPAAGERGSLGFSAPAPAQRGRPRQGCRRPSAVAAYTPTQISSKALNEGKEAQMPCPLKPAENASGLSARRGPSGYRTRKRNARHRSPVPR